MIEIGDCVRVKYSSKIGYIIRMENFKNKKLFKVFYENHHHPDFENFYEEELEIIGKYSLYVNCNVMHKLLSIGIP